MTKYNLSARMCRYLHFLRKFIQFVVVHYEEDEVSALDAQCVYVRLHELLYRVATAQVTPGKTIKKLTILSFFNPENPGFLSLT